MRHIQLSSEPFASTELPKADRVYLKRDIKSHKVFEDHPNLMFGMLLLLWGILFLGSMFLMNMIIFWGLILALVPIVIWVVKNNENTNLTKSSAFVERDGVLYYIRLGYTLDYQQPGVPIGFKKVAIARENVKKTKHIQRIRESSDTYSQALTDILNSGRLPSDVITFCEMQDCQLEKEDPKWIWLSYHNRYTNNQRVTQKFRNVYSLPFQAKTEA